MSNAWDMHQPLARARGESAKANQALWDYAQMGEGRSLVKLIAVYRERAKGAPAAHASPDQPPTLHLTTMKRWSRRYSWQERLEVWRAMERSKEEAKWEERRESFRELIFSVAEESARRVQAMMDYPLTRRVVLERDDEGAEKVIQVEPVNWNMMAAAKLLAEANKAGRLALGESTENYEQRQSGTLQLQGYPDLEHLEDAELDDLIQRTLDRITAPGPEAFRAPDFSEGSPPDSEGSGSAPGGQGSSEGNA